MGVTLIERSTCHLWIVLLWSVSPVTLSVSFSGLLNGGTKHRWSIFRCCSFLKLTNCRDVRLRSSTVPRHWLWNTSSKSKLTFFIVVWRRIHLETKQADRTLTCVNRIEWKKGVGGSEKHRIVAGTLKIYERKCFHTLSACPSEEGELETKQNVEKLGR